MARRDQRSQRSVQFRGRRGTRCAPAAASSRGKTQIEIAQQHLTGTPDVSGVPAAEQKVLLRALAKKPEQRYPDCKAFVQDLAAAIHPKTPPPSPSRRLTTMLLTMGLLVTASVLLVLLWKIFFPSPAVQPTVVAPHVDWQPDGWEPSGLDVEKDSAGGTYYRRLVKKVGDEDVVMVLVKREKSTDPPTFYMMENKVWNKLYQEFVADPKAYGKWQLALGAALGQASSFTADPKTYGNLQRYGKENKGTVNDEWRKGGWAPNAAAGVFRNPDELGVDGARSACRCFA